MKKLLILILPVSLFAQTAIYRSVQPGITSAIGTSSGTVTIVGSTATFTDAQPDSVGVGDALQYDSDGNSSIDAIAFIHGRTSSTVYTIKTAAGGTPTAVTADGDWDIFRSYTALVSWEAGSENNGINATVRNFDGGNRNIDTANERWFVACYPGEDGAQVNTNGWTTSATDKITIYTPYLTSEVGTSMRHSGVYTTARYRLVPIVTSSNAFSATGTCRNVDLEGIQIYMQANGSATEGILIDASGSPIVRVFYCIIKGNTTQSSSTRFIGVRHSASNKTVVANSIIYDFNSPNTSADKAISCEGGGVGVVYNTTMVDNNIGIDVVSGSVWANGNIANNNSNGYNGTFQTGSSHNLSDISSDSPGTDGLNSVDLTFVDYANDNFHLAASDVALVGTGLNISTYDANADHNFTDDIDRQTRVNWNRGADEYIAPTVTPNRRKSTWWSEYHEKDFIDWLLALR